MVQIIVLKTPNPNVIENPLMGPEPMKKRIIAAIKVVTLASNIALKAWEKPVSIELIFDLPNNCSSLILSKIRTFASTAIPTVKAIPAIPGNVKVASKRTNQETRNSIFIINTVFAIKATFP